jgi:hypothetical protein
VRPQAEKVLDYHAKALDDLNLLALAGREFGHLRYPRHVDYDPETGEPISIICRGCGAKIAGWVDDDVAEQRTDRMDKTNVVTKMMIRQKFSRLANCTQLRMLLDDNALYEPLLCRECALAGVTEGMAQELWLSDLIEMIAEAMARSKNPDRAVSIVRVLARRRVERF